MTASREPCPAIYQDNEITIVLPHVKYAHWSPSASLRDDNSYEACEMALASSLIVQCGTDHPVLIYVGTAKYKQRAIDFLRALNLYWETRV